MYTPNTDGINHINIYSKGKTEIGKWLTNFAYSPFFHHDYGHFNTMEGFWYWHKTGRLHEEFRTLNGFECKKRGKTLPTLVDTDTPEWQALIRSGIRAKLTQHGDKLNALIDSDLPLTHYYVYGHGENVKVVPAGYEWITEYINEVRTICKESGWRVK